MVWLIIFVCLLLIGLIPLGIGVQYDDGSAKVWVTVGLFRFFLYPRKNPEGKQKHADNAKKDDGFESHAQAKKKMGNMEDYFSLVQLFLDFLTDFRTRLKINDLQFKVILAGDDPCELSINYGRAWAALSNLMPHLERCFLIKKRDLEILCDYTADNTLVTAYLNMTVMVGQLVSMVVYHGTKFLRKYFKIKNKSKDGAII